MGRVNIERQWKKGKMSRHHMPCDKEILGEAAPKASAPIVLRHQEWEVHVRKKQKNTKTALDAKLK